MKNVLFFAGLLLFSIQAFSQQFEISGIVTQNGKPLKDASVYVQSTGSGTVTNELGAYSLELEKAELQDRS